MVICHIHTLICGNWSLVRNYLLVKPLVIAWWFSVGICKYKRVINHMTCYNSSALIAMHWLKLQHSDWRANLEKDFFKEWIFHQWKHSNLWQVMWFITWLILTNYNSKPPLAAFGQSKLIFCTLRSSRDQKTF